MWPLSLKICGGWGDDEDQDQVQNQDHVFSALVLIYSILMRDFPLYTDINWMDSDQLSVCVYESVCVWSVGLSLAGDQLPSDQPTGRWPTDAGFHWRQH